MRKEEIKKKQEKEQEETQEQEQTQEQEETQEEEKKIEEMVDKVTETIVAKVEGSIKKRIDDLVSEKLSKNSKVTKILEGAAKKEDYSELTTKEKIVAFYQAAIQSNHAALKALSEGTAADGGYLFPDEFRAEVVRAVEDLGHMRREVRVVPMKRDVMKIPTLVSGPQVTWTDENTTKSTTTAHFGEATLTAKKMAAIMYASDELIEDSTEIDVVKLIIQLFAEAIGREEDKVIAQGNGTTQPTGLTTARTAGTISSISCSGNLSFDDIINLEYELPREYHPRAKFYVNRTNIRELRKLKDNEGRYLWSDPRNREEPPTLHGYPVVELNYLPESEIYFGDLKAAYWLGDRKRMTVKVSQETETAFTKDQTAIRVVERIAGNVVLGNAVKALISIP